MNETESIARAGALITQLEAFAHAHPFVTAWAAATILSWLATVIFKKPIRALAPDSWDAWCVRAFDAAVAGAGSFYLLKLLEIPFAWLVVCSLIIGFGSPLTYWALASLACWRWPGLRKYLSLRELAPDPDPDDQAGA